MSSSKAVITTLFVSAILALTALAGCMPSENMRRDAGSQEATPQVLDVGLEETSIVLLADSTPARVDADLGNITIDADVRIPLLGAEVQRVLAERRIWKDDELGQAFPASSSWGCDTSIQDGVECRTYSGSEGLLVTSPGFLSYRSGIDGHHYDIPLMYCNARDDFDREFPAADLEGFTQGEAIAVAEDLLKELGLEPYACISVNTLNVNSLNRMQEANVKDSDDFFKINQEDKERVYGADDEVIVLGWQLALNGIPLSRSSFSDETSERYIGGCQAEVWMGRNGPVEVRVSGAVAENEVLESFSSVVSLGQAIEAEMEKYSQVVSESSIEVSEIELEYVAFPADKDASKEVYDLAWVLSPGHDQEKYRPLLVVDAFNGKVL